MRANKGYLNDIIWPHRKNDLYIMIWWTMNMYNMYIGKLCFIQFWKTKGPFKNINIIVSFKQINNICNFNFIVGVVYIKNFIIILRPYKCR